MCNQALGLREQIRFQATYRALGALWDKQDIALWQTRLAYATANVTKHTLKATFQRVELEENTSSYTVMKDHYKKRFPGLGCRRLQEIDFCDLFQESWQSGRIKREYTYNLLIAHVSTKKVHGFGMKNKDEAPTSLVDYFHNLCVLEKIVKDGGGGFTSEEWENNSGLST